VSQSIRPALALVPAQRTTEAAHRERDLRRLLASWRQLAARLICVQAHGGDDELELIEVITALEEALRARHGRAWRAMQADLQQVLVQAEAEHTEDPASPATACLPCRRLATGLPISVAQLVEAGRSR
jgi:hypothetical protein